MSTFPSKLIIDIFPLQTHSSQQLIRKLKHDLFPPSNDINQSQKRIIQIIDSESINQKVGLQIFAIVDQINDAVED